MVKYMDIFQVYIFNDYYQISCVKKDDSEVIHEPCIYNSSLEEQNCSLPKVEQSGSVHP